MRHDDFWAGYRQGIDFPGRPDLNCVLPFDAQFWHTKAKKHPRYVHSVNANSCLIHKVAVVEIYWYTGNGSYMKRLDKPYVFARTICQFSVALSGRRFGKACEVPDPNAVLCGMCHGDLPTFSKSRTVRIKKQWAKDHLGCKGLGEVIGPYEYSKQGRAK